jgi:membrane protein
MRSLWTRAGLTWWQLGKRFWRQVWEDEVPGRCAELAYFFLFSAFPLLLFLTTLLGYVAGQHSDLRWKLFWYIARLTPSEDVVTLLNKTLDEITASRSGGKLSLGLLIAIWVASNGMLAVERTLNRAYGFPETRPWWRRRLVALALTVSFALLITAGLVLILYGSEIVDALADRLGISWMLVITWHLVRWPLVAAFLIIPFDMIYNFAPDLGARPRRQWGTPGAVTGVVLFLGASFGFRFYLSYVKTYTTAYGSLGVFILLLVWFYLTAFAMVMGGELNSEISNALAGRRGRKKSP